MKVQYNVIGSNVAGICAYIGNVDKIDKCYNKGTLQCNSQTTSAGIISRINQLNSNIIITNTYNEGEIPNSYIASGIIGEINIKADGVKIKTDKCYNSGKIESEEEASGIIARIGNYSTKQNSIEINNSYNTGEITAKEYSAGIITYISNIENLKIDNTYNIGQINGYSSYTAGIITYMYGINNVEITNSYNAGNITAKTGNGCGGIIAYTSYPTKINLIENCYNTGNITSSEGIKYMGGIIGYGDDSIYNIKKSYNKGNINDAIGVAGGVIGYMNLYKDINIEDCYNTGNVCSLSYNSSSQSKCGGIIGYVCGSINLQIQNTYNSGEIIAGEFVGGIIGHKQNTYTKAYIYNCYNKGNLSKNVDVSSESAIAGITAVGENTTLNKCYNTGKITSPYFVHYVGGIIGRGNTETVIENSYNTGDIELHDGCNYIGGIIGQGSKKLCNVYNEGSITITGSYPSYESTKIGGILGSSLNIVVENCYNTGNINSQATGNYSNISIGGLFADLYKGEIKNGYNIGEIIVPSAVEKYTGALIGYGSKVTMLNVYYSNDGINIFGTESDITNTTQGNSYKSIDEMKKDEFVNILNNGTNIWVKGTNDLPTIKI